jgi:pimeloyl-ACP methyl ester carboxylesterase
VESVEVNGVQLEYEVRGAGEPVLLIDMLIADCFVPLLSEPALTDRYQLIRYHKRGWVGSTHTPPPVSISDHAADAAALLEQLGVRRAHIAGHSSGASIGAQLALDHPERVHTLTLLEPTLVSLPLGGAFLQGAGPVFEAYGSGDHSGAFAMFVSAASGLDRKECRALLEERIPGAVTQSIKDADTFFGVELPALTEWTFEPEQAATIRRPVLSVTGAETQPLWVEIAEFLRASLPDVEECTIDGVGHLLQIQRPEPVAEAIADFLERHPIPGDDGRRLHFDDPAQPPLISPRA